MDSASFNTAEALEKYSQLAILFDGVALTQNPRLIVLLNGTTEQLYDTLTGKVYVTADKNKRGEIRAFKDIIEIWKNNYSSEVYRVEGAKGSAKLSFKKIISQSSKNGVAHATIGKNKVVLSGLLEVSKELSHTIVIHNGLTSNEYIIVTKHGVIHNKSPYLHVYESVRTHEILGVKHLYVPEKSKIRSPLREIDVLDHLGRYKKTITDWGTDEEGVYGASLNDLYSRGGFIVLNRRQHMKYRLI